jgi:hypothetical protein
MVHYGRNAVDLTGISKALRTNIAEILNKIGGIMENC